MHAGMEGNDWITKAHGFTIRAVETIDGFDDIIAIVFFQQFGLPSTTTTAWSATTCRHARCTADQAILAFFQDIYGW
jgi:hypothetical protein